MNIHIYIDVCDETHACCAVLCGTRVMLCCACLWLFSHRFRESLRARGLPTSDVNAASEVSQLLASKLLALHEGGMTDLSSRELVFYKPKGKRYHGKLRALVEGLKDAGVKVKHAKRGKLM